LSREEHIIPISQEAFDALWVLTEGKRVEKARYFIDTCNGYVAELDIYKGSNDGLVSVEVEFPNEEEAKAFVPPFWFGREVTGESAWKNSVLAK
jgi:CYTH domain-containing protein